MSIHHQLDQQPSPSFQPRLSVIGIGASAGGLTALRAFFRALPDETGLTFVVVVHLSPEHESVLAELLQPYTHMRVVQVTERIQMQPDHVYVIPPAKHMVVTDSALDLMELEGARHRSMQIDAFFRSLAENHGDGGAVILSGSGSDGAVGIQAIKERGGLLFVQSPDEAEYDGMPRSAIATGLVDIVAPVAELATQLVAAKQVGTNLQLPNDGEMLSEVVQQTLIQILAQLRVRTGHDFSGYKQPTLLRRLARRMQLTQLTTLTAYLHRLRQDSAEVEALFRDLLINVTEFFRDREAWAVLETTIIPQLFAGKSRDDSVRVWTVGCATGEEAYSIAMLLLEYAGELVVPPSIQVFASDLGQAALDFAREGCYPEAIAVDIVEARLARFFTKDSSHYRVRPELREAILFTQHNLLQDPPFSRLDLIICRNLLIYIQRDLQEKVFETFYYALRPEGYLFLGNAESAEGATDLFDTLDKRQRLYQRHTRNSALPILPSLPLLPHAVRSPISGSEPSRTNQPAPSTEHQRLLEVTAPPSLLIDRDYNVLHLSETVGRYLLSPGGTPTVDVLKLVRPELQAELRAGIFRAFETGKAISTRPVPVRFNGAPHLVYLMVRPHQPAGGQGRALVIFLEDETPIAVEGGATGTGDLTVAARQQLEAELRHVQGRLQSMREEYETTVEELRAANEELQSTNEEYKSTLEELETSKEELQSINEELQTINQELKTKIEEVTHAHSDVQNLFIATDIATLFLDRELRVKRYTPSAADLFNLMPTDKGRPIAHLRSNLLYEQLEADAQRVLAHLAPIEGEVQSQAGRWFLVRVRPYRTLEDKIDGVVITFVDITSNKQNEEQLQRIAAFDAFRVALGDALRSLTNPVEVQATAARILGEHLGANQVHYGETIGDYVFISQGYGNGLPPMVGRFRAMDFGERLIAGYRQGHTQVSRNIDLDLTITKAERAVIAGAGFHAYIAVPLIKQGEWVATLAVHSATPRNWTADEIEIVEETAERTWAAVERARAEAALAKSEEKFRTLFNSMDEGVVTLEVIFDENERAVDFRYLEHNPALTRQTGLTNAIIGKRVSEVFPDLEVYWLEAYARVVKTGEAGRFEYYFATLDSWFDIYISHVGGVGSRTIVAVYTNITERKRREADLAFLAEVSADFAPLMDIDEVMQRVGARLARHLRLSRCDFSLVDERADRITTVYDWRADEALPSMLGEHQISTFLNEAGRRRLAAGHISAINNVRQSSLMNAPAEMMQALGIGAVLDTPYLEHGRWCFLLSACRAEATIWREDEIALVRELTTRIYIRLERARAESAQRRSEERFRALVANGADMITISDRDGRLLYASPTTQWVTGYTPEEYRQQQPFALVHPDDRAHYEEVLQQLVETPGLTLELQHRFLHKDGTWRWVEGAFTSLYHEPAIGGLVANVRDITARKEAEAALQHLNATLEQQVDTRTAQVRSLASSLTMAEQEERRRISQILHDDLQQLLYGIQMRMMALITDLQQSKYDMAPDYAQEAYTWLGEAIQTARQLTVDLSPPILKGEGLVEALHWLASQMAAINGLQVELRTAETSYMPNEDMRVLLFQIVRELLFNVVKHAQTAHATVELYEEAGEYVIKVSDKGCGFDVTTAAVAKQEGGFGLFSVRERLHLFGGHMDIQSTPGLGTQVIVYAPISASA